MRKSYLLTLYSKFLQFSHIFNPGKTTQNNLYMPSDDSEMKAAIHKAQETLPIFINVLQSPKPNQTDFALKAGFPMDEEGHSEFMFVHYITYENSQFRGILGNEPYHIKDMHLGDSVLVDGKNIGDWLFVEDGKLIGGFTFYVMLDRMSERKRKEIEATWGFTFGNKPLLP